MRAEGRGEGGGAPARQPTPANPYAHAYQPARQQHAHLYACVTPATHQLYTKAMVWPRTSRGEEEKRRGGGDGWAAGDGGRKGAG